MKFRALLVALRGNVTSISRNSSFARNFVRPSPTQEEPDCAGYLHPDGGVPD